MDHKNVQYRTMKILRARFGKEMVRYGSDYNPETKTITVWYDHSLELEVKVLEGQVQPKTTPAKDSLADYVGRYGDEMKGALLDFAKQKAIEIEKRSAASEAESFGF